MFPHGVISVLVSAIKAHGGLSKKVDVIALTFDKYRDVRPWTL